MARKKDLTQTKKTCSEVFSVKQEELPVEVSNRGRDFTLEKNGSVKRDEHQVGTHEKDGEERINVFLDEDE